MPTPPVIHMTAKDVLPTVGQMQITENFTLRDQSLVKIGGFAWIRLFLTSKTTSSYKSVHAATVPEEFRPTTQISGSGVSGYKPAYTYLATNGNLTCEAELKTNSELTLMLGPYQCA